jgi:hypothetical protein
MRNGFPNRSVRRGKQEGVEDALVDRLGDQRGGSEWEPIKILLEGD